MAKLDDFIKEFRAFAKAILKQLGEHGEKLGRHGRQIDTLSKELRATRLESRQNWQEQREFNQSIEKKVDMVDSSVKVLDKRVRYQKDMPERLEQVENDAYELKRRVTAVEQKVA